MLTAITHHRFGSPLWGEDETRNQQPANPLRSLLIGPGG
jgi:hypothetical protein